ncbi:stress responsive protein [Fibrobacterales bacterium]|nr:stress responsive protein [Fibrobacterales bacterium]
MKPIAEGRTGKENAEILAQKLNALRSIIPIAVKIEAGVDFSGSDYDIALHSEFKTAEDLNAYQKHPAHEKIIEWVKEVRESRAAVDFEG